MENLNAEQIKSDLEHCKFGKDKPICEGCNYKPWIKPRCFGLLCSNALALINSQEQRIGELTEQLDAMRGAAEAWKEHSKTLEGENEKLKALVDDGFDTENALNEKVKELTEENERLKAQKYMAYPDGRLEMIPSVESARAEGEWEDVQRPYKTSAGGKGTSPYRLCSACKWEYPVVTVGQHLKKYKYCPNCGARMKGDTDGDK